MHSDTSMPTLESNRLILREITINDAGDMFAYACDPDVSRYTTWESHQSVEDTLKFINVVLTKYELKELTWGIVDKYDGQFIGTAGYVYINSTHSRAEIGYALSKKYWGQGIMTEAVQEIIRYGFQELSQQNRSTSRGAEYWILACDGENKYEVRRDFKTALICKRRISRCENVFSIRG